MRYFDLHCDTLVECLSKGKSLLRNDLHVSVEKGARFAPYIQCAAVWLPDTVRGAEAFAYFERHADFLDRAAESGAFRLIRTGADVEALENARGVGLMLTVEGGAAIAGKLENIACLRARGVRMMTLTWNGSNEIGSGVLSGDAFGLTPFGRQAVAELERQGIVIDVSHASERLFEDVASNTSRPFVASHSNAKAVCGHARNLTDAQFAEIRSRGGLVGLNFYKAFLNDAPEKAGIDDLYAHAEHFLALGGENVLAMGSDFDGSTMPRGITGLESVEAIAEAFLRRNLSESLVRRIFFENAASFFKRFDRAA